MSRKRKNDSRYVYNYKGVLRRRMSVKELDFVESILETLLADMTFEEYDKYIVPLNRVFEHIYSRKLMKQPVIEK